MTRLMLMRSDSRTVAILVALFLAAPAAAPPTARAQAERETPIVQAVRRVSPSVVNIHGQKTVRATAAGMAGAQGESMRRVNGMGTGVIIDPRGYLVTNFHVVDEVNDIRVTLSDGRSTLAEVIAHDQRYDLALLKINVDSPLPVIPRGTSDDLMVGERVIAIGNAFGYEHTVTDGIISALHRDVPVNDTQEYRDLIQTSAGINPGNSGGPLLNITGEMIGINVAVRVGAQAIAFAIPINQAMDVVSDLIGQHNGDRVALGISAESRPCEDGSCAFIVTSIDGESAGTDSSLQVGDRIKRVAKIDVRHPLDMELALLGTRPGEKLELEVDRAGQSLAVGIGLREPANGSGAALGQRIWNALGLRAKPLSTAELNDLNRRLQAGYPSATPHQGGLQVTAVRSGSPADRQMIRPGDVLLGIHRWQTTTLVDLDLILHNPEMQRSGQARFYIVRRDQMLEGLLQIAQTPRAAAKR